ncbi:L-aminoadipate-semialdehyde dehydrogenase-phosphopantetheinyl transferase-like [Anomaloglossus baeobatrachus]|uniref:L-aminoadipate-semialdehyde dehydrogenase-phosphopantetheinyl transferase-like n=1 Tax=Anomaloglossus baeobatrachus TaxID=238106 RepID=UPI003F5055C6
MDVNGSRRIQLKIQRRSSQQILLTQLHALFMSGRETFIRLNAQTWRDPDLIRTMALKESFIKAIGVGLGFNLQRIEFEVSPVHMEPGKVYTETKMWLDDEDENWAFEEGTLITVLTYEDLMASALPIAPEDSDYWDNFNSKQEFLWRQISATKTEIINLAPRSP